MFRHSTNLSVTSRINHLSSQGILGIHSLLTQEQSSSSEIGQMKEALRELDEKAGRHFVLECKTLFSCVNTLSINIHLGVRYEPSQGVEDHYGELQKVDVSGLFRRLKQFDNTLVEIILNNAKEVDDVLMAIADFLARMNCVTKISVANTKMCNAIGMVMHVHF